jgi:hypothetical protein
MMPPLAPPNKQKLDYAGIIQVTVQRPNDGQHESS